MTGEIWESNMKAVFVAPAVLELSEKLGFPHIHPRDRFWELLELGGITPVRVIPQEEGKALAEGVRMGSLNEPVRLMFIQKKTSLLLRLGIGLTELNRRVPVASEKDRAAAPDENDIKLFLDNVERLKPKILGFVTPPDMFVQSFQNRFPGLTAVPGPQPIRIAGSEIWLLGSTTAQIRGAALTAQEDLFFALGERISAPGTGSANM